MENEEAKLSVGNCLVKGITSREFKEMSLISRWKAEEFDEKLGSTRGKGEKDSILKAKAKAVADIYFEHLASMIVKHDFKTDGVPLDKYLGTLSDDDVKLVEDAGNRASSITREETQDLSRPSGTESPQSSKRPKIS